MEKLEKKLKISEKTCIHCPTEELAKHVLSIFNQLGLKWCNGKSYIICTNWDNHKEDTIYYPFEGEFSSLKFADLTGYKVISAEEFIALHTVKEKYNLENYEPKGNLIGFPKEIIARMLECQEEQGNKRNVTVFEKWIEASQFKEGFAWDKTKEDREFWDDVIRFKDFNLFFEKYPKQDYQDNPQEFKVGDEVIDIITRQRGKIHQIFTNDNSPCPICVSTKSYTLDGRYYVSDKYPRLLHYRDDYDYSIINFNNLPKREEAKRWRAKKGDIYYSFKSNFKVEDYHEGNDFFSNEAYDSGNYFQTKEEAQEVADKLNKYFQELIKQKSCKNSQD